ncbi:MAG: hypothetical protein EP335_02345 [Alphaproteobacteria bacterium]|nr:MAG: hypothetical protein EP335_02345 [Alphaproteobacteria bacterium]
MVKAEYSRHWFAYFPVLALLALFLCTTAPAYAGGAADYRILNSYLVVKLQPEAAGTKLVGASWLRLRNLSGETSARLPFVLNSGLKITRITDQKNRELKFSQKQTELYGPDRPLVTEATVTLRDPLGAGRDLELMVYYDGSIRPMAGADSTHQAIVGYWNYAYPIPAAPRRADLEAVYMVSTNPQRLTVELPDGFVIASNLPTRGRKLVGDRVEFDLGGDKPLPPPVFSIAPFGSVSAAAATILPLPGNETAAQKLATRLDAASAMLGQWLGDAPTGRPLVVADMPPGVVPTERPGLVLMPLSATAGDAALYRELAAMWLPPAPPNARGSWRDGLAALLAAKLAGGTDDRMASLDRARAALAGGPVADGLDMQAATLFFHVLEDLVGERAFFAMVRDLRTEFASFSADTGTVAGYLMDTLDKPEAVALVDAWLIGGAAPDEIRSAAGYDALLKNSVTRLAGTPQ